MSVLVTGGAGYIGSHMTLELADRGDKVVVLDNLTTGVRALVAEGATFVQGDIRDSALVRDTLKKHDVEAVIHFAGSIVVPESVENPLLYYANNTAASRDLIESCVASRREASSSSPPPPRSMASPTQPSIAEDARQGSRQPLWPLQADDGMDAGGYRQRP